jgi:predicted O-methyltransferase YrrM
MNAEQGKNPKRRFRSRVSYPLRSLYYTLFLFNWYFRPKLVLLIRKTFGTGEVTNFTYDLSEKNLRYLAHTISLVTSRPVAEIAGYIAEARRDAGLKAHIVNATRDRGLPLRHDVECLFGRRLGWYALARVLHPKVVVETGVDRGHGAALLCAALLRNASEGFPGRYYGLDIAPGAGWLLSGPYAAAGTIVYGDAIASLHAFNGAIDLYINDSDHSADYEYREYVTIANKLSPQAVVLGDNAHATDKLSLFSEQTGRRFLFFREEPVDHWYPGAGIGISFN